MLRMAPVIGLLLSALILCFAPIVHAICIAPPMSVQGGTYAHTMPGGTTMVMGVTEVSASTTPQAAESTGISPTSDTDLAALIVGIALVAGGIALALLVALRALLGVVALLRSSGAPSPPSFFRLAAHPPQADVSLIALGISRT